MIEIQDSSTIHKMSSFAGNNGTGNNANGNNGNGNNGRRTRKTKFHNVSESHEETLTSPVKRSRPKNRNVRNDGNGGNGGNGGNNHAVVKKPSAIKKSNPKSLLPYQVPGWKSRQIGDFSLERPSNENYENRESRPGMVVGPEVNAFSKSQHSYSVDLPKTDPTKQSVFNLRPGVLQPRFSKGEYVSNKYGQWRELENKHLRERGAATRKGRYVKESLSRDERALDELIDILAELRSSENPTPLFTPKYKSRLSRYLQYFKIHDKNGPFASCIDENDRFIVELFVTPSMRKYVALDDLVDSVINIGNDLIDNYYINNSGKPQIRRKKVHISFLKTNFIYFLDIVYRYIGNKSLPTTTLYKWFVNLGARSNGTAGAAGAGNNGSNVEIALFFFQYIISRLARYSREFDFDSLPMIKIDPLNQAVMSESSGEQGAGEGAGSSTGRNRITHEDIELLRSIPATINRNGIEQMYPRNVRLRLFYVICSIVYHYTLSPYAVKFSNNQQPNKKKMPKLTVEVNESNEPSPLYTHSREPLPQITAKSVLFYNAETDTHFIDTYQKYREMLNANGGGNRRKIQLIGIAAPIENADVIPIKNKTGANATRELSKKVPIQMVDSYFKIKVRDPISSTSTITTFHLGSFFNTHGKLTTRLRNGSDVILGRDQEFIEKLKARYEQLRKPVPDYIDHIRFFYMAQVNGMYYYVISNEIDKKKTMFINFNGRLIITEYMFIPPNQTMTTANLNRFFQVNRRNNSGNGSAGQGTSAGVYTVDELKWHKHR